MIDVDVNIPRAGVLGLKNAEKVGASRSILTTRHFMSFLSIYLQEAPLQTETNVNVDARGRSNEEIGHHFDFFLNNFFAKGNTVWIFKVATITYLTSSS